MKLVLTVDLSYEEAVDPAALVSEVTETITSTFKKKEGVLDFKVQGIALETVE